MERQSGGEAPIEPWVPITTAALGAMVALVASSTVADILTVQTRRRRRLDKELPILSRPPEGHAKERVTRIVRSDAPEVVHRGGAPQAAIMSTAWWSSPCSSF